MYVVQAELDLDSLLGAGPSAATAKSAPRLPFRPAATRPQPLGFPAARTHAASTYHQSAEESGGFDDNGCDDFGGDDNGDHDARHEASGPGTPPAEAPHNSVTQAAEEVAAPATTESSQPKLSLSKSTRKLKMSEPVKSAATSTGGSVWGYKPDLAGAAGNTAMSTIAAMDAAPVGAAASTTDVSVSAAVGGNGKVDPRSWLLHHNPAAHSADAATATADAAGEEYVNMFWLDAAENNGVLYLFGKVPLHSDAQGQPLPSGAPRRFVSCCVAVHGCERNLFVLPRLVPDTFKEDGTAARLGMADVYKELNSLLGALTASIALCLICLLIYLHCFQQFRILFPERRARPSAAKVCVASTPSSTATCPGRRRST